MRQVIFTLNADLADTPGELPENFCKKSQLEIP
jgi:hypothetical protein